MAQKEITIAGHVFTIEQPYAEGHTITAGEAKALNQTRAENIRNNMASTVKKAEAEGKLADMAAAVAAYDSAYDFTVSSGATRIVRDPLEKECRDLARAELVRRIKAKGEKVKDYAPEVIEGKVDEWASNPKIVELAKKNLAARKGLADALGDI